MSLANGTGRRCKAPTAWPADVLHAALATLGLTATAELFSPGWVAFRCPHCGRRREHTAKAVREWAKSGAVPTCRFKPDCPPSSSTSTSLC